MPTLHLIVKGKVQGVFYRASAQEAAEELGVTGWVKNTREGDVEIMATGTNESLEHFVNWCRKGPQRAVVTEVLVTNKEEKTFDGFRIERYL